MRTYPDIGLLITSLFQDVKRSQRIPFKIFDCGFQATSSVGAVVDRAEAWCEMIDVFYRRINPQMYSDVPLDAKDDQVLVNMLWESQVFIFEHRHILKELADRLA